MKTKWNEWLSDIDGVVEICIRAMNEIAPENKNGASYESIARKWFTEMPLHAYALSHFNHTDGYQIQLQEWRNKFSHRYKRTNYWYKWFEQHYPIYTVLVKGNEYKGNTRVMIHPEHEMVAKLSTPAEIGKIYETELDPESAVDWIDIDLDNLQRFIRVSERNVTAKSHLGARYVNRIRRNIAHAYKITKLALYYDDQVVNPLTGDRRYRIPQPYKISPFGRRYYTGGFALQNKSEAVRTACMGRCWSIDIDSSVFRFYKMLAVVYGVEHSTLDVLLSNKAAFRVELAGCLQNISTDVNYLMSLVKQAITALGFGARDTSYWDPTTRKGSAISEIIKNKEDRDRLTEHPRWRDLKRIYAEIRAAVRADTDVVNDYRNDPVFWTKNKFTMDRLMSLLYQRYEAQLMERCIELLTECEREPRLWVHDGVYVLLNPKRQGVMYDIEQILQEEINPYVKFEITEHEEYTVQFTDEIRAEEELHRQNISAEEMKALYWAYDTQFLKGDDRTPRERVAALRMQYPELYKNIPSVVPAEEFHDGKCYDGSGRTAGHYTGSSEIDPEYWDEYYAEFAPEYRNDK